ncbi:hypothetical protein BC828DRAFT_387684 [Blastocladiella britannica]|nr:hypothetical protein BC828DRAFT_387684 [Blastocladiella britannica]
MLRTHILALGGASCSGKSTLAQHMLTALATPAAANHCALYVMRQDAFFKPTTEIPLDPTTGIENWDVPGAIDFGAMHATLAAVRAATSIADLDALWRARGLAQDAQDHMRTGDDALAAAALPTWMADAMMAAVPMPARWPAALVILDGFMLFHDDDNNNNGGDQGPAVLAACDAATYVVADAATCVRRRDARSGYACADGVFWADPPGYFASTVWPAFLALNAVPLAALAPAFSVLDADEADAVPAVPGSPVTLRYPNAGELRIPVLMLDGRDRGPDGMRINLAAVLAHVFKHL